jgi:hypothetical protein
MKWNFGNSTVLYSITVWNERTPIDENKKSQSECRTNTKIVDALGEKDEKRLTELISKLSNG